MRDSSPIQFLSYFQWRYTSLHPIDEERAKFHRGSHKDGRLMFINYDLRRVLFKLFKKAVFKIVILAELG